MRAQLRQALAEVAVHQRHELTAPTFVQARNDGDVLDLLLAQLAVGPVDLREDVARVDEEHPLVRLALVKEPQRAGQATGVEKLVADGHHHIDVAGLDQLLAGDGDLLLGAGLGEGENEVFEDLALKHAARERGVLVGVGEMGSVCSGHSGFLRRARES